MHRFLIFAGVCFWLVALTGCGGDDATPVASNDGASSEEDGSGEGAMERGSDSHGNPEGGSDAGYMGGESDENYMGGESDENYMGGEPDENYMGGDPEEGYMGGEPEEGYMDEEEYEEGYMGGEPEDGYMDEEEYEDGYMGGEPEDGYMDEEEYEEGYEEGYMDGEYEEGYMGEGSGTRGGYEDGRSRPASPPRPVTLADKSKAAFAQGREREAFQYLFAHAVTVDDAPAKELLDKMGLLVPAKRPAMAVRWGIGIEYTSPKNYEGNAYPIGTNQSMNAGGGGGGGGGGGYGEGGGGGAGYGEESGYGAGEMGGHGPGGGNMDAQLKKLTGELGERLVGGLRDRVAAGAFGKVLAEAMTGSRERRPGTGGPNYGGGEEEGYMGEGYGEQEDYGAGGGEETEPGAGYSGGYSGGYGQAGRKPKAAASGAKEPTQLMPGVVFVGVGDDKVLKQQAKDAELDVLVIFEVAVKFNVKRGVIHSVINETTIALYNVLDDRRPGHETEEMNNIQVQVARGDNDKDVVEEEMEKLFAYIDATWLMTDLPSLTEKQILDRLRPIITEPQENPLPILAEIRMYQTRKLLKDENVAIACKALAGDPVTTTLTTGTEEAKKLAIQQWMPNEG